MTAKVEDGNSTAVAAVLEDIEQVVQRRVAAQDDFAETLLLGAVEHGLKTAPLARQFGQVAVCALVVVGKGQEDDGFGVMVVRDHD